MYTPCNVCAHAHTYIMYFTHFHTPTHTNLPTHMHAHINSHSKSANSQRKSPGSIVGIPSRSTASKASQPSRVWRRASPDIMSWGPTCPSRRSRTAIPRSRPGWSTHRSPTLCVSRTCLGNSTSTNHTSVSSWAAKLLEAAARTKIGRYREGYANRNGATYAFLPCVFCNTTSEAHPQ